MPSAPANDGPDQQIRLVRGTPTAAELAALVAVLMRRSHPAAALASPSAWVRLSRPGTVTAAGLPALPGATAWRGSVLPR
jgi:hypothetical protein